MSENEKFEMPEGENPLDNIDGDLNDYFVPASDTLLRKTNPMIAIVYGKIWLLSRKSGYCYMSLKKLAKQLGISKNSLVNTINILCGESDIGSGNSKTKNKYFNKENCLLIDVTPKEFLSAYQVRWYAPLRNRFADFVKDNAIIENNYFELTPEQKKEIEEKIHNLDESRIYQDQQIIYQNESRIYQDESKIYQGESRIYQDQQILEPDQQILDTDRSRIGHKDTIDHTSKEIIEDTTEETTEEKKNKRESHTVFPTEKLNENFDSDSSQEEDLPALALTEKLRAYADQYNNGVLDSNVIEAVTGMSSSWGEEQPEFIFDEDDF